MLKNVCTEQTSKVLSTAAARSIVTSNHTDFPDSIEIETDSRCNRSCFYCPVNKKDFDRGSGQMSGELFKKIIIDLAEAGYNGIIRPHLFNEPLLDTRLTGFIKFTKEHLPEVDIEILSNGDFLDVETYSALINVGVKAIRVTQHGSRPSEKLNKLLEYLFRNVDIENRLRYRVFSKDKPLANRGGLVDPDVLNVNPEAKCEWPMENMAINFRGNILLCCNDFMGRHIFGDALEKNVIDIWNSKQFKSTRKKLREGDLFLEICRKCQDLPE